jgi:flagellar biosynthesis/type III secretory pathway chaperone
MKDLLHHLIEALREELKEYGEMLALLDQQQTLVMRRETGHLVQSVTTINCQVDAIAAARREREQRQRHVARLVELPEEAPFAELVPQLPDDYRPLVQALVQENNELLGRIQRRARQNHLLLTRTVELMQRLLSPFFPGTQATTYDEGGVLLGTAAPQPSLYNAIG